MTLQTLEQARATSDRSAFGNPLPMFTDARLAILKQRVEAGTLPSRLQSKWNVIAGRDNAYQPQGPINPWSFPDAYDDPDASAALIAFLRADIEPAVDLGIRWRLYRNPADAAAVARILTAWSSIPSFTNNGESRLNYSNKWPLFIQAAQLISDSPSWAGSWRTSFISQTRNWMQYSTAYLQTENRAMWGVVVLLASAAFLGDRPAFDRAIARWRELMTHDVVNNELPGEIDREGNGLFYCNFFLNAATQAAEIARYNGEWLYDFVTRDGSTLKGVSDKVNYWTRNPTLYPYWQPTNTVRIQGHVYPLHALWPSADSAALIATYTMTQDFYGYRNTMLAYQQDLPLYG